MNEKEFSLETAKEMVTAMIRASSSSRPHVISPGEIRRIAKIYGVEVDIDE